jgi:hypothetical protein
LKHSHIGLVRQNQMNRQQGNLTAEKDPLLEQRLELATEGLEPYVLEHLKARVSPDNAMVIAKYILSMK